MTRERKTVMKKYYLQVTIDSNLDASTKAVQDCNKILHQNGYEPFEINLYKSGNKYIKKVHNFLAFNHLNKIDEGALLVVPHPLYVNKKYIDILEKVKQKKHIKLAFLIHDLDSLRKLFLNVQDDFEYMDHKMYDISDYIIAHNDCMIDYLVTQGVKREKIHNLHIFDYLCESNNTIKFDRSQPNEAHKKLAALEQAGKLRAIVTQNIDGLHQKAGSKAVFELHGSIYRNYCEKCGKFYPPEYIRDSDGIPRCTCGGRIKPDVVLYEESLDQKVIEGAVRAIADADVLIVGGTSLTVYPAAGLIRYYRGNKLVLINRDETPYDGYANLIFRDPIGKVLGAV